MIGELNLIAPIISQFFLLSYALVNYACVAASLSKAPGWRPKFSYYHPVLAGAGALLCIVLMFAFDWLAALVAVLIAFAAHRYLDIVEPAVDWGTASDALRYLRAVRALHALNKVKTDHVTDLQHAKVFRPSYLVVLPGSEGRPKPGPAVGLVKELWRGRGLSVIGQVLKLGPDKAEAALAVDEDDDDAGSSSPSSGPSARPPLAPAASVAMLNEARAQRRRISRMLDSVCAPGGGRRAFFTSASMHSTSFRAGVRSLMESSGVSSLRWNTLTLEWPFDSTSLSAYSGEAAPPSVVDAVCPSVADASVEALEAFEGPVFDAYGGRHGVMIVRDPKGAFAAASEATTSGADTPDRERTIDLWWLDWDGGLALLVPYLLKQSAAFDGHKLRVFTSGSPAGVDADATVAADERTQGLARLINMLRFEAETRSVKLNATDASVSGVERFRRSFPGILSPERVETASKRFRRALTSSRPPPLSLPPPGAGMDGPEPGERGEEDVSVHVAAEDADAAEAPAPGKEETTSSSSPARSALEAAVDRLPVDQARRLTEISLWTVRAGDLIREHSSKASTVFIVFPQPRRWFPLGIETAWMDALSHSLPPTVLIRGNGAMVVTDSS